MGHSFVFAIFSHIGFIVELILLPVLVFYFLTDGRAIRSEASLLVPLQWRPQARRAWMNWIAVLDGYIRGQVIMCLIAWVMVTGGLLLLHVPHAFTLGLIAGVTRAVPVIGPLLGGIPLVLICLITTKDIGITTKLLIGFAFMHFLESKVLLPKIVGHEVDLHPVSVIVALLLGLKFFGFMGIFLAVPIAAVLKISSLSECTPRKWPRPSSATPGPNYKLPMPPPCRLITPPCQRLMLRPQRRQFIVGCPGARPIGARRSGSVSSGSRRCWT